LCRFYSVLSLTDFLPPRKRLVTQFQVYHSWLFWYRQKQSLSLPIQRFYYNVLYWLTSVFFLLELRREPPFLLHSFCNALELILVLDFDFGLIRKFNSYTLILFDNLLNVWAIMHLLCSFTLETYSFGLSLSNLFYWDLIILHLSCSADTCLRRWCFTRLDFTELLCIYFVLVLMNHETTPPFRYLTFYILLHLLLLVCLCF
jgi:hypothetical protein